MYVTRRLLHTRHYSGKDKTKVQKKQVILLTANRIDNYCYKEGNEYDCYSYFSSSYYCFSHLT